MPDQDEPKTPRTRVIDGTKALARDRSIRVALKNQKTVEGIMKGITTTRHLAGGIKAMTALVNPFLEMRSSTFEQLKGMSESISEVIKQQEKISSPALAQLKRFQESNALAVSKAVNLQDTLSLSTRNALESINKFGQELAQKMPQAIGIEGCLLDHPMTVQKFEMPCIPPAPEPEPNPAMELLLGIQEEQNMKEAEHKHNPRKRIVILARMQKNDWMIVGKATNIGNHSLEITGQNDKGERTIRVGLGLVSLEVCVIDVPPKPPSLEVIKQR